MVRFSQNRQKIRIFKISLMERKQNIFVLTIFIFSIIFTSCRKEIALRSPVGYRIEGKEVVFEFDVREYEKVSTSKSDAKLDFEDIDIKDIAVSGEFNNWSKDGWTMSKISEYVFQLRKPIKQFDDQYKWEYKYVINGEYWAEPPKYASNKTKVYPLKNSENLVLYAEVPSTKGNTTFRLEGFQDAQKVYLTGNFVDWKENAILCSKEDSAWVARTDLGEGKYLYKFMVDGKWYHDPNNPFVEDDGQDGFNSILYKANTLFELKGYEDAEEVYLAGDFNGWNPTSIPCTKQDGKWIAKVFLESGKHEYKFIIDGTWTTDPDNPISEGIYTNSIIFKGNVDFKLAGYPKAKNVYVTGSFNGWNEHHLQMSMNDGIWVYTLKLPEGKHEYKFIVDGEWIADPANPAKENDRDGNINSILLVEK